MMNKHDCGKLAYKIEIKQDKNGFGWEMIIKDCGDSGDIRVSIEYCPFCGLGLDRKTFECEWLRCKGVLPYNPEDDDE
jgi:hypothetical protein